MGRAKSEKVVKKKKEAREKEKAARDKAHAAGHTYDYFKDKWDKFDVDAALDDLDQVNLLFTTVKIVENWRTVRNEVHAIAR